jgi:hypothetical protein
MLVSSLYVLGSAESNAALALTGAQANARMPRLHSPDVANRNLPVTLPSQSETHDAALSARLGVVRDNTRRETTQEDSIGLTTF